MTDELVQHHAFFIERMRQGLPIQAAIEQLASEAPQALADLCVGDLAIKTSEFMQLAFPFVPLLEAYVPEKALYLRLLLLYPDLEEPLFSLAQERHSKKQWLIELIRRAQNPALLAEIHFMAQSPSDQDFWLPLYIELEFMEGVWALAKQGDLRPVFILLKQGQTALAARAAAFVLEVGPDCGLIEMVVAQFGPQIGPWLNLVCTHFESAETVEKLSSVFKWYSDQIDERG